MPKFLYLLCILLTHFLLVHCSLAQIPTQKTTKVGEKTILQSQSRLQCIDFAISKSITLANINIDKQIATAKINELKAVALPQIHGNVSIVDNFVIPKTFFNAQQFNPNLPPDALTAATLQAQYGSQAMISVTQTLFNPSYSLGSKAAKIYTELAEKNGKQTENEIHYTISKAYYTVLVNEERLKIVLENLKSMEELLRTTQAMFENGTIEKLDVSKIEVRLANLQTEFDKLTQLTELAKSLLKFQMGLSQDDEITLSENISSINLQVGNASHNNYDYNQTFDYNLRNEFIVLQSQKDLQNLAIQSHARSYLPSAHLFANGGVNTGSLNFGNLFIPTNWYNFFSVGINVNIPIFDGFKKLHLGQQKKLTLQKTENSLNELKRSIDFQQKQTYTMLKNAHLTLKNQQRNKELALEVLQITKIKYTEGIGTNSEVLAADAAHKEAESNYFSALYEVLMAKIEFDKSLGNRN